MTRILRIANDTITGLLRQHAIHVVLLGVVATPLAMRQVLFPPDPTPAMLLFVRSQSVAGSMTVWAWLGIAAAVCLGAIVLTQDIASKTLLALLAHPVRRSEFLVGRWLGIVVFSSGVLATGTLLSLVVAAYFGITPDLGVLAIASIRALSAIALFAALGLAAVAFGAPVIAAIGIAAIIVLKPLLLDSIDASRVQNTRAYAVLTSLLPPDYAGQYRGVTWAPLPGQRVPPALSRPPAIDFSEQGIVSLGTMAYAAAYLIIGCAWFERRDIVGPRT